MLDTAPQKIWIRTPKFFEIIRPSIAALMLGLIVGFLTPISVVQAGPDCGDPKHSGKPACGGGGGGNEDPPATYDVDIFISDVRTGGSHDDWEGNFNGRNGIGLNNAEPESKNVGMLENLSFFHGKFSGSRGSWCFPGNHDLIQALLDKGKGGRAEGRFWFQGATDDGQQTPVGYVLIVFGQFDGDWPPSTVPTNMEMSYWEINTVNEGGPIKRRSCIGEGEFKDENDNPVPMVISVSPIT